MSEPIDTRERDLQKVEQYCVKENYKDDLEGILVSYGEIKDRVDRLAEEITIENEKEGYNEIFPICVLKGASKFYNDLIFNQNLETSLTVENANSSKYGKRGTQGKEEAEIVLPSQSKVEGRNILLIEDIVDEGGTMKKLLEGLEERDPNSIRTMAMFDKRENRKADINPDYLGFVIRDEFVVGYGLDYKERYRDLRHLAVLKEEILGEE